jgi:hypothetical protein
VYVGGYGIFEMQGGTVSDNIASTTSSIAAGCGGGVYVNSGVFTMSGGTVSNNIAENGNTPNPEGSGGGIFVAGGVYATTSFTMSGGEISNNKATKGGGVSIIYEATGQSAEFIMSGGSISANTAADIGGGVCLDGAGAAAIFRISGGTVYGNDATAALKNNASAGAALQKTPFDEAKYGSDPTWTDIPDDGSPGIRNNTIKVVNGVLQP